MVDLAQLGLQFIVQWVASFLVPEQRVLRQGLAVVDGGGQVEPAVGVHRQLLTGPQNLEHRLNALAVFGQGGAANLHLDHRVAARQVAFHFLLEAIEPLAGVVVATGRVDEHARVGRAVAVAIGQQLEQRLARYLCRGIPHGHVDGAHGHRALAVAAGLLVDHHAGPDLVRVQVLTGVIQQAGGLGLQHARDEAVTHQRALAVAAIGVEAIADHGLAVADHVGDHSDEAERHLREVDVGVADV